MLQLVHRYVSLASWLVMDSLLRFRKRVVLLLLIGPLGIALQVQAIGLVFFYAHALTKGEAVTVLGHVIDFRESLAALFIVAATGFLLMILAAAVTHFAQRQSVRLSLLYEEFCTSRLIALYGSRIGAAPLSDPTIVDEASLLRVARKDARYCGVAFRHLINMVAPLLTFVVALGVLFYVNFVLTSLTLLAMGGVAYCLVRISRHAASRMVELETSAPLALERFQNAMAWHGGFAGPAPDHEMMDRHLAQAEEIRRWRDSYEARFRVLYASEFVSKTFLAFAILLAMSFLGPAIILGDAGWERLAVYLIALRFALHELPGLARRITTVNRYYPHLLRYREAVRSLSATPQPMAEFYEVRFRVDEPFVSESLTEWQVRPAERLGVISPFPVNRYELGRLVGALFNGDLARVESLLAEAWFITDRFGPPPSPAFIDIASLDEVARSRLSGSEGIERSWHRARQAIMEWSADESLAEAWGQFEPAAKIALCIVVGLSADKKYVFVAETSLRALPVGIREEMFALFEDSTIFIVSDDLEINFASYGTSVVLAIDEDSLIGMFSPDQFVAARESIQRRLGDVLETQQKMASFGEVVDYEEI